MSLLCAIVGHKASAKIVRNEGVSFSRCARCAADLVQSEGRWDMPPAGYRVVWKPRERALEPEPLELSTFAPIAPPVEAMPAVEVVGAVGAVEASPIEGRSGTDRRAAQSRVLTSLRSVERRRGGDRRRTEPKKQALPSA